MTPLEQLAAARADVTRLTGIEAQFNALMAQIPGGDLPAVISEYNRRGTEVTRLQGIEAQWTAVAGQVPNGDVSAFMAEHTRLSGEVARLTGELETLRAAAPAQEQVEQMAEARAAEIVAQTGNQPPAAAETTTSAASAEPQTVGEFAAEHARLTVESSVKGSTYYRQWGKKFGF